MHDNLSGSFKYKENVQLSLLIYFVFILELLLFCFVAFWRFIETLFTLGANQVSENHMFAHMLSERRILHVWYAGSICLKQSDETVILFLSNRILKKILIISVWILQNMEHLVESECFVWCFSISNTNKTKMTSVELFIDFYCGIGRAVCCAETQFASALTGLHATPTAPYNRAILLLCALRLLHFAPYLSVSRLFLTLKLDHYNKIKMLLLKRTWTLFKTPLEEYC